MVAKEAKLVTQRTASSVKQYTAATPENDSDVGTSSGTHSSLTAKRRGVR